MKRKVIYPILCSSYMLLPLISISQKWYYNSMHEKMQITDTSMNLSELNKCNDVYKRILISLPGDSLALHYQILSDCFNHFYSKTFIYFDEQKKMEKSLHLLDSISIDKNETIILTQFFKLLCFNLSETELDSVDTAIVNFKKNFFTNDRIIFLETFVALKKNRLSTNTILKNINEIKRRQKYVSHSDLKINWGLYQLPFLVNYVN